MCCDNVLQHIHIDSKDLMSTNKTTNQNINDAITTNLTYTHEHLFCKIVNVVHAQASNSRKNE